MIGFWLGTARAAIDLGLPFGGQASYPDFNSYFTALVNFAVLVAGLIAVLMIVYAGLMYSQSAGQADKASQAKELVAGALTGLALLLMIRFILPTLNIGKSVYLQVFPTVLAQKKGEINTVKPVDLSGTNLADPANWQAMLNTGLQLLVGIAALAAFSGIVFSGYLMITSGGDAAQMAKAKANMIWAIAGLLVAMFALVIVRFVVGVGASLI